MWKLILMFVLGLIIGGAGGFFGGSKYAQDIAQQSLATQQEEWDKKISGCNEEKEKLDAEFKKIDAQFKVADAELKLNENREGFVSGAKLPAPQFDPPSTDPLETNTKGDVLVKWTPVKGAKKYVVKVEDKAGNVVHTSDVEGETYVYVNILLKASRATDAEYFITVATVNGLDQEGDPSEKRPIHFGAQASRPTKTFVKKRKK